MSGYPDERPPGDPRLIEMARGIVTPPAILLILIGLATAAFGGLLLAMQPQLPAALDEAVAKIEADPAKTPEEKKQAREFGDRFKQMVEDGTLQLAGGILVGAGLLALIGGVKLITLSGVVLPMLGAVAVLTPFTASLCCVAGLPVGIWVMVVVNQQVVRSAIAARRAPTPPADPDAQYMR